MRKETEIAVQHIRTRKGYKIGRPRKKPHTWLFPQSQEREYTRQLISLQRELSQLIKENLFLEIPSMVYEVSHKTPNDRHDDYLDRLNSLILYIRKSIQGKVDSTIAQAVSLAQQINLFNYAQFQKVNENVLGVDIFVNEPWLADQLKLFASQNAQLINSIPDQELERVAGIIERNLQDGTSIREIEKEIQKSFSITRRRAKLIARDQTSKLNSSLTKLRQQEVGVTKFYWQTSGDERVRPSHALMDGKLCSWSNPNIYYKDGKEVPRPAGATKTLVGHDVNCRCVALPYLDDLIDL